MGGAILALLCWTGVPGAGGHPMHTAVVELSYDGSTATAELRVRLFADDFAAVIAGDSGAAADSTGSRYLRRTLSFSDPTGRPLPLRWQGAERVGEVVIVRLAIAVAHGLAGVRVASRILCERFADQITIVRASYDGRTTTLLFSPGDGPKALP